MPCVCACVCNARMFPTVTKLQTLLFICSCGLGGPQPLTSPWIRKVIMGRVGDPGFSSLPPLLQLAPVVSVVRDRGPQASALCQPLRLNIYLSTGPYLLNPPGSPCRHRLWSEWSPLPAEGSRCWLSGIFNLGRQFPCTEWAGLIKVGFTSRKVTLAMHSPPCSFKSSVS